MGKNRVKGIVVEIGGDTIGLNKALDGTNKKINSTQSNLKDVERLLKLDPTNTKLLEQKQRLLGEAIAETEEKLQTLNEANEQVKDSVKNYDEWKAAYDPIQQQIEATKKKLKEQQAALESMQDKGSDAYKLLAADINVTKIELQDLKDEADEVNETFGNPISIDQFESLQREIEATKIDLRKLESQAEETDNKLSGIDEKPIDDVEKAADQAADALEGAGKEAATFGDILKAEAIVEGAKGIVSALKDVTEESKEYRKIMGSLEVSSEAANYSAVETQVAFKKLYGVLADDQSTATTLANLQALGMSQEELLDFIDVLIGGWAMYGDSIPIDGLAEAINETYKTGKVTGVLADILNWGAKEGENYGNQLKDLTEAENLLYYAKENDIIITDQQISQLQEHLGLGDVWDKSVERITDTQKKQLAKLEALVAAGDDWNNSILEGTAAEDQFNIALQQCSTEEERLNLIMQAMADQGLAAAGEKWRENNAAMVESNETAADLQEQMALIGEKIEPLVTRITGFVVQALEWFNSLDTGTQNFILATVAIIAALGPVGVAVGGVSKIIEILSGTKLTELSTAFGKITGTVLPGVQAAFSKVFGFIAANPIVLLIGAIVGLVALVATKGDEIQGTLQNVDDFVQNVFVQDWTEVFGPVLGGILNKFLGYIENWWNSGMEILNGFIDFIRGVFTGDWERAWEGCKEILSGILDGMLAVFGINMDDLKTAAKEGLEKIKSFFSAIEWKLPRIKLPHFSVSGSFNFSSFPPSVPKIAVDWYARGGILKGAQLFGWLGDSFLGGGEAGPEAVLPLSEFYSNLESILQRILHSWPSFDMFDAMHNSSTAQALTTSVYSTTTHLGGVNINVYGSPGQDVHELAEIVMEEMQHAYGREEAALA